MSFLMMLVAASLLAYAAQRFFAGRRDIRTAMRHGMGVVFVLTGTDHFASAATRYVPMMPDLLSDWAFELVYFTGAAEIAGGVGLLIPAALYARLSLPNLQRWAAIGLAVMLAFLVIANINVAIKGTQVEGLAFGAWYYMARPFFQPIFIAWALYAAGVVGTRPLRIDAPRQRRHDATSGHGGRGGMAEG